MDAEFVTAKEVAKALGVAKTTILRRAEKEGWPFENGKNRAKQFYLNKLPEDVRVAVMTARTEIRCQVSGVRSQMPVALYKGIARSMPKVINDCEKSLTVPVPVAVGSPELTDRQNRVGLARADLIRAYTQEKNRAKKEGRSKVEAAQLYIKGYNTGQLLPRVYEILGETTFQTVERWSTQFRRVNYDYTILAPKTSARKGWTKVTDQEFNTALSYILHPNRLRVAEVTRLTKMSLKKRGIESPSHEDTIRRVLTSWKKQNYGQWVFCREGEKALNDKVLPYLERDVSLLDVGEVLVADGHVLNFQSLHPFTGKPARMMMVLWYDWASAMPVGWEIMPTENIQCVAAGMRRAILSLGKMPKVAYLDNGKAFKAKIFTDADFDEAGFYGMFARLGMETLFAWPYNAQSKVVERFFGTFAELERLMPTYTGTSIQNKPANILRNEKLHKKLHDKKYGGWVPTIKETNRIIAGWVEEYADRPHRGLKGLRPLDVFESGRGPGVDEQALRYLMMSMEPKSPPGRNGVRFLGRNYYDDALYGYRERVLIRYDLEDLSRIYVYDITGDRQICEARPRRQLHPVARISGNKEDLAAVTRGIKQKRSLKRATEMVAREYVASAPDLVALPERTEDRRQETGDRIQESALTRAEAEKIEAEAAEMKVLELVPEKIDMVYMSEADRYEALLEQECTGDELVLDEMTFMRYFEKTAMYRTLKERFEFLRETWLIGEEEESL